MLFRSFGFEEADFHKIQIACRVNNLPSKKVIEKCGFKYDGKLRDYYLMNGEYIDRLFYSLLQDEFKEVK